MHRSTRSPPPSASRVTRCGRVGSSLSALPVPSSAASAVRVHTRCMCISRTPHARPPPSRRTPARRAARRRRRPQGQLRVHGDGLRRRRGPVRQCALPPCAAAWPLHLRPGHRCRALLRVPLHPGGCAAITARLPLFPQPGPLPPPHPPTCLDCLACLACLPIHMPARRPLFHPPPLLVSVSCSSSRAAGSCSPSSPASPSPAPAPPTGARCSPSLSSRASCSWARCSPCPNRRAGSPRRGARRRTRSQTRSRTPSPGPEPQPQAYLAKEGRTAEAQEAATRLWGPGACVPPVEASDTAGGSWAQLVSPRYRRLVAISSLLFVFQQFAGINAVVFFSTKASATSTGSTQRGAHTLHMQRTCSAHAAHMQRTLHTQHSRVVEYQSQEL